MNLGSRSEVKALIKSGRILVNKERVLRPDLKVDEESVVISYQGREYRYRPFVYYMMNKPAGVLCATRDSSCRTVLSLFMEQCGPANGGELSGIPVQDIFPVGRLDKDTVGLLLLTNDGELAHRLLSPRFHVPKTYYVETDFPLPAEKAAALEAGVDIGDKEPTRKAVVTPLADLSCTITITEGRFHQVKRMFQTQGLTVTYLKRLSMGGLALDPGLSEGQIRELTKEEVDLLWQKTC